LIDQDRSLWNGGLIEEGLRLLTLAAQSSELSSYHLEAAISAAHARAGAPQDTDWAKIVWLYDMLMAIRPGPVVALNRAIAIAEKDGPEQGLAAIRAIDRPDRLARYPFFPAALGELELRRGDRSAAATHFRAALALARSPAERRHYQRRINACDGPAARGARVGGTRPAVTG
jgi:RNA polymerase sigma-70 factor (ECF subfamily)